MKKLSGVYCIENLANGKRYIGQSVDLKKRKYDHFRRLNKNLHGNTHLQRAYNKYGRKYFEFKILIYGEPFELTRYEQFFVDLYSPEVLYNNRLQCMESNRGIPCSEERKEKISKALSGKKLPKETREKMSKAHSGKNNPMYGKKGKDSPMYGKSFSKEAKEKISKSRIGEKNSSSILTKKDVLEIRNLLENTTLSHREIGEIYGVCRATITAINCKKIWTHI